MKQKKAIQNYSTIFATNTTTNNSETIINYYYGSGEIIDTIVPPRPKLNIFLAVLGCFFYLFPGIIYIVYVKKISKKIGI